MSIHKKYVNKKTYSFFIATNMGIHKNMCIIIHIAFLKKLKLTKKVSW